VAGFVQMRLLFPTGRHGIAKFHDVIKIAGVFHLADEFNTEEARMLLGDWLVALQSSELSFVWTLFAAKLVLINGFERLQLTKCVAHQPDLAETAFANGGDEVVLG